MVEPLLKWAGGKRWLINGDKLPRPRSFTRYVEPFLGGGAVFFHLEPETSLISDKNSDLIDFYRVVRDSPKEIYQKMVEHQRHHSHSYYYDIRDRQFSDKIAKAAAFLYLNRTCWNGLYRVNRKGIFNVPIGTKNTVLMNDDDFDGVSKLLSKSVITSSDFEETIDQCRAGDFVFVDPPYTVKHNHNGFIKYNEEIFSWQDQIRLSFSVTRAVERGAAIIVTNADHASIRDLYGETFSYRSLTRHSVLSASPENRRATTEAIFTANL